MRVQRSKLMYRVVFPFDLKLGAAASAGCDDADAPYSLFAVIVHGGLDHGAQMCGLLLKSAVIWRATKMVGRPFAMYHSRFPRCELV